MLETGDIIYGGALGNNAGNVVFDGGDGDDEIWANANNNGQISKYYGGNGDDILKGALNAPTGQLLAGQGGRDLIDTAWLDDTRGIAYGIDDVDLNIWGDWGYGGEGTEYDPTMQYGDPRLEEQLWGDDDIILVGEGYGD